jgi:hypothetical protein
MENVERSGQKRRSIEIEKKRKRKRGEREKASEQKA